MIIMKACPTASHVHMEEGETEITHSIASTPNRPLVTRAHGTTHQLVVDSCLPARRRRLVSFCIIF